MPDATGLELLARELRESDPDSVADTEFFREKAALHIAPKLSPLNIRWQENGAAGVLSARSIVLDLSMVPAGKYSVKLEVGDDPKATTSRIIEVK